MKSFLLLSFVLFSTILSAQDSKGSLIMKKWYYCDTNGLDPSSIQSIVLYAEEIACSNSKHRFFWEFTPNHHLSWDFHGPSKESPYGGRIGSIFRSTGSSWSIDMNTLIIATDQFIFEVISEDYLLLRRIDD
ncbi:MAG: hypothetical protein ACI865_002049 [Flavobacteriaceae bacterium]|jgi:hypothetical protein